MKTIDELKAELAALPDERDVPNTPRAQEESWRRRQSLLGRKLAAEDAEYQLARRGPQLAALIQQEADLSAIREEACAELLVCPPRERNGLELTIRTIDGRFELHGNVIPANLPLFAKLKARGYVAPPEEPWNPMAALYGSLPEVQHRRAELQEHCDGAQRRLEEALKDDRVTP